jgi:hypothetical protein
VAGLRTPTGAFVLAGLIAALPGGVVAQALLSAGYDELARDLDARVTFETLPRRDEPGIVLDAPLRDGLTWIAERFAGQRRDASEPVFDTILGAPRAPLGVRAGERGANQSVAFHRGFGSSALFPLGPAGFPALEARGEGSAAILFDQDQHAFGLRLHSDYPDPLGQRDQATGTVTLTFYTRQGREIARVVRRLEPGITELGFRRAGGLPDIAGVLILSDDPGGIAIDDILYQTAPVTG